jgi:hypothetical protein
MGGLIAMNCREVADKLSQFMDGELDSGLNERVSLHIESCDACKRDLESFRRIGERMREVEAPVDTEWSWGRIEAAIPSKLRLSERRSMKWLIPVLALAASVGFALARVTWYPTNGTNTQHEHATHEHGSLAVDFRNVIEFAQLEPQKAISNLVEKYDGKQLDTESATKYIGYRPALFNHVPDGFQRVSTHVLNMPCCKCTATVCQRPNGTSVIVFEHKDEQPVWFGDLPSIDTPPLSMRMSTLVNAGMRSLDRSP